MTVNGIISASYAWGAIMLFLAALALIWQGRNRITSEWPVSFLVALGGWVAVLAVFIGHLFLLRVYDPPSPFNANGLGTAFIRLLWAAITTALAGRVIRKQLATKHDLDRLKGRMCLKASFVSFAARKMMM